MHANNGWIHIRVSPTMLTMYVCTQCVVCRSFVQMLIAFILVWPTQMDPAIGTLCVCVCVFLCVRSLFGVTSSNVELRNYVISRQIVIERRVA